MSSIDIIDLYFSLVISYDLLTFLSFEYLYLDMFTNFTQDVKIGRPTAH